MDNGGKFPESLQGKHQRQGVMWQSEDLKQSMSERQVLSRVSQI